VRARRPRRTASRILSARPWRIFLPGLPQPRTGRASSLVLLYGFLALIALGTILLVLPFANRSGQSTPVMDALFTSTSAVCVTGLVVVDTGDHWSFFGQMVILALIQIGGFGFMTSATLLLLVFGRRIGLRERLLISDSMGGTQLGGLVRLIRRIALYAVTLELVGAVVFFFRFSRDNSVGEAVWKSLFHSVSAFNNAGFDLFGGFRSLSGYHTDGLVVIATAVLIILGGISFMVVADVLRTRGLKRLSLNSKLVLSTTALLLVGGMALILLTEFRDPDTLGALSVPQKLLSAFFQSVTARTAGFSTTSMAGLADFTLLLIMLLMFVGGASGSTAGGVKVNTFGLLLATIWSAIRGREEAGAFGREFSNQLVHRALAVALLSLGAITLTVFLLTVTEESQFVDLLFESVSAFGTVGLSTSVTPGLSPGGKAVIAMTMLVGRLGPLTLALSLIQRQHPTEYHYPKDAVTIG